MFPLLTAFFSEEGVSAAKGRCTHSLSGAPTFVGAYYDLYLWLSFGAKNYGKKQQRASPSSRLPASSRSQLSAFRRWKTSQFQVILATVWLCSAGLPSHKRISGAILEDNFGRKTSKGRNCVSEKCQSRPDDVQTIMALKMAAKIVNFDCVWKALGSTSLARSNGCKNRLQ